MKKIFFISILTLFSFTYNIQAQERPSGGGVGGSLSGDDLKIGFLVNPTTSWLRADGTGTTSKEGGRLAVGYGITVDYKFSNNDSYYFSTGLIVTPNGGKYLADIATGDTLNPIIQQETTVKIQHLEIPLTLKLKTDEFGYFSYFGQVGLAPAIAVRTRYDRGEIVDEKASALTTPFNLSLIVGAGVEYSLGASTSAFAGIYFNNGLINTVNDDTAGGNFASNNIGLRAGIFF